MALVLANRVQESGTANTTVSFTLTGAVTGFQSFSTIGNSNTTYYSATDASGNWEVGLGTYSTTGPTLTRTTVYASSNSGSAVTFSGAVNVFVTYPSGRSVNLNETGNVSALGTVSSGTWQGGTIQPAYGGTGLTTFTGANNALYSTGASTLVAGTLPVAAGGTGLTSFTANGVPYASATNTLTTGSALTFDGTNLETTGNTTLANNKAFQIKNTGGTAQQVLTLGNDNNVYLGQVTSPTAAALFLYGNQQVFSAGGSEQMRLTSTGLGIGNSSPTAKLDVTGTAAISGAVTLSGGTANGVAYLNGSKVLTTGSALTFDGTNLGVNCTATNFGANYRTVEARGATTTTSGVFRASSSDSSQKIDFFIDSGVGTLRTDSDHPLAFSINNAEQMRLTSTGLGIGTNSPGQKFVVNGASGVAMQLENSSDSNRGGRFVASGSAASGTFAVNTTSSGYALTFGIDSTEQMRLTSTGLGIGTTNPSQKLVVSLAGAQGLEISPDAVASAPTLVAYNRSGGAYVQLSSLALQHVWQSGSSPSERMRLDSSGNLGIGTSLPSYKLDVLDGTANGNVGTPIARVVGANQAITSETGTLSLQSNSNMAVDTGGSIIFGGRGTTASTNAVSYGHIAGRKENGTSANFAGYLQFGTSDSASDITERMRLDSSGNLGLGVTPSAWDTVTPAIQLANGASFYSFSNGAYVGANLYYSGGYKYIAAAAASYYQQAGGVHYWQISNNTPAANGTATFTQAMTLDASGNLLVGTTTTPTTNVKGVALQSFSDQGRLAIGATVSTADLAYFYSSTALAGAITVSGSTCSYTSFSDYRLKNTIAPMTGALAKVALLKPCTYKWNADGSDGEGFIAHELAEVVPQCVTGEKDAVDAEGKPVYQGIDTSFLVATLTAAIQELKAEVDSLKAQLKGNQP